MSGGYPLIGVSKEALEFEERARDFIVSSETEVCFIDDEKRVTFQLASGAKWEFTFPMSKIVKWHR